MMLSLLLNLSCCEQCQLLAHSRPCKTILLAPSGSPALPGRQLYCANQLRR